MDVERVIQFLRSNGLSEVEQALNEDMKMRESRSSSTTDTTTDESRDSNGGFRFPMNHPPLPPVRVPSLRPERRKDPLAGPVDVGSCRNSGSGTGSGLDNCSEDEFVSMGSSTSASGVCNSDFTNPYGQRSSTQADSETSSDRLSQFGTAREYHQHEFDMQTDLWYGEKEESGHYLTPNVEGFDPFGGPSEDKFVMTLVETGNCLKNLNKRSENEKKSEEDVKADKLKDCFHVDEMIRLEFDELNLKEVVLSELINKCQKDDTSEHPLGGWIKELYEKNSEKVLASCRSSLKQNDCKYEVGDGKENAGASEEVTGVADDDEEASTADDIPFLASTGDEYEIFDLRIIHRKNKTGFEENKELPIVLNSVIAGRYYVTEYLGSAAFSKVVQARDTQTGVDVCLKIIKNDKDFFDQSLDEIKLLKYVNKHDPGDLHHIIRLYDYFYHQEHLFIVCELLKANLYEFQKYNLESGAELYFTMERLQAVSRQCLEALSFLHEFGIIHCDLKPENILIKSYSKCEVKVIDLGSSCFLTDTLSLYVQSRSYRAPEVILGLPYGAKIDIWSLGCILAELCSGEVLFPNDAIVMLLARLISLFGHIDLEMLLRGQESFQYFTREYDLYYINEDTDEPEYIIPAKASLEDHLPGSDSGFVDFLKYLLQVNPKRRPTAKEALQHPWLTHQY